MATLPLQDVKIRIRPENGKIYFTIQDIQNFPEWPEGPLIELINGELYSVPSPTIEHQKISSEIHFQIKLFLKKNNLGQIFPAPFDVIFSDEDVAIPDLVFVSNQNQEIIKEKAIEGSPDLIIEIVSSNKKQDYVDKKELYKKNSVKEYWIVDPQEKIVLIFILEQSKKFKDPIEYKITDEIPVKSLLGLKVQILN